MQNIGWHDVRIKFKHSIRRIFYVRFIQWLLCKFISSYIKFILLTSKKTFNNLGYVDDLIDNKKSFIAVTWHNRIALSAFSFSGSSKLNKEYQFHVLASKHGDGAIVGKVMENCGVNIIFGSTQKSNSSKKSIDISNFRKIFKILKGNNAFCVTPDGPRGPRFRVGGEVVAIAKLTSVPIIPTAYSITRFKVFKSWDRFIFPFPFSKITFLFGEPIMIPQNANEEEIEKIKLKVEDAINFVCQEADRLVATKPNLL